MANHRSTFLSQAVLYGIVLMCCALPVMWVVGLIVLHPTSLQAAISPRILTLWWHTMLYNAIASIVAVLLGLPAAIAMGRDMRLLPRLLWWIVPLPLLLPSIVLGYGWMQMLRILHIAPMPQSVWDIARCVLILGSWLWPITSIILALSLRRMDRHLLEHAAMDGALVRTIARRLVTPMIAAFSLTMLLALQEFSIYEPTGISVVSTETRLIFETGQLSNAQNPIVGLQGGVSGRDLTSDLSAQSALALSAGMPLVISIIVLCLIALPLLPKPGMDETPDLSPMQPPLRASWAWSMLAWGIAALTMLLPLGAMIASLNRPFNPLQIYDELAPQLNMSLLLSGCSALIACIIAITSMQCRSRLLAIIAVGSFLIGGQFLAISLLRLFNYSIPAWGIFDPQRLILDSNAVVVFAYIGRFAWIAILAGRSTQTIALKQLRELAAIDGANSWQTIWGVILPLYWPLVLAGALLVGVLSLTEVPATALLVPPSIVPMLLTWVHMQRYGPMLEASLTLATIVITIALIIIAMLSLARLRLRGARTAVILFALLLINGCKDPKLPDEIWLTSGRGEGECIYPRGICYDNKSDTFFIVDRLARIQHLDNKGKFLNGWQMPNWEQGKPVGLTVGPDGNLWIADTHYFRVVVYSFEGKELKVLGKNGSGKGEFELTTDIAFDSKGNIFVAEYGGNDRIQVFDPNLNYLYTIGSFGTGDGQFSRPQSIAILNDELYVADSCNHRINVFKADGTFIRNMGKTGSGLGEYRFPYGLDFDSDHNLIITEFGNNRVQKVDRITGKGIATWGTSGRLPGELAYPWSAAVDKNNRVITVDSGNNRLQVIKF